MSGGSYHHFGVEEGLRTVINNSDILAADTIYLQINIDGLPLHKSTNAQFWPILGLVANTTSRKPFLIGLFHGTKKPLDRVFLSDFITEAKHLSREGFVHNSNHYCLIISCLVCVAPARAFVKNIKGHSGYLGCDRCTQYG